MTDLTLVSVDVNKIFVNPFQPRRDFLKEELEELAESIKMVGVIHPPVVRPRGDGETFELVSGERRFRASQLAGLTTISVIVRSSSDEASAQAALIENMQRVDLNPIEIAKALKSLIEEFDYSHDELSSKIGKKRSTVANYIRLLGLPKSIQDSVTMGSITMGHAKSILSLEGVEKQNLLHELVMRDDLTVRETEEMALKIAMKAKNNTLKHVARDFYLEELAEKIQVKLGTKVNILGKGKRGRVMIDYYNLDDLDRLLRLFGVGG